MVFGLFKCCGGAGDCTCQQADWLPQCRCYSLSLAGGIRGAAWQCSRQCSQRFSQEVFQELDHARAFHTAHKSLEEECRWWKSEAGGRDTTFSATPLDPNTGRSCFGGNTWNWESLKFLGHTKFGEPKAENEQRVHEKCRELEAEWTHPFCFAWRCSPSHRDGWAHGSFYEKHLHLSSQLTAASCSCWPSPKPSSQKRCGKRFGMHWSGPLKQWRKVRCQSLAQKVAHCHFGCKTKKASKCRKAWFMQSQETWSSTTVNLACPGQTKSTLVHGVDATKEAGPGMILEAQLLGEASCSHLQSCVSHWVATRFLESVGSTLWQSAWTLCTPLILVLLAMP